MLWGPVSQIMAKLTPLCMDPQDWGAVIQQLSQISRAHPWAGVRVSQGYQSLWVPRTSRRMLKFLLLVPHGRSLSFTSYQRIADYLKPAGAVVWLLGLSSPCGVCVCVCVCACVCCQVLLQSQNSQQEDTWGIYYFTRCNSSALTQV